MAPITADPSSIPARWSDVTPEWMTAALARRFPGATADEVRLVLDSSGTNRRARFAVSYSAGTGPEVVFLKGEGAFREIHARNDNMFNEPELFASGVPLPVDHPDPYHVIIQKDALDYLIVMEDVAARGGDTRDATMPLTPEQVADGLRGLARLHSQYWGYSAESEPRLAWARTWEVTDGFLDPIDRQTNKGIDRSEGRLPSPVEKGRNAPLTDSLARYLRTLAAPPTFLHGDPHIGNTYVLPDNSVGFLDWQCVRRGNWSFDVGYFVVGALPIEECRAHERDLLAAYLEELDVPAGERPSWDEAWTRYRVSAAYGLPVWLATLGADGSQTKPVCLNLCERYGAAYVDLDAVSGLAELGV